MALVRLGTDMLIPMEGERTPIFGFWFMLRLNDLVFFICFRRRFAEFRVRLSQPSRRAACGKEYLLPEGGVVWTGSPPSQSKLLNQNQEVCWP